MGKMSPEFDELSSVWSCIIKHGEGGAPQSAFGVRVEGWIPIGIPWEDMDTVRRLGLSLYIPGKHPIPLKYAELTVQDEDPKVGWQSAVLDHFQRQKTVKGAKTLEDVIDSMKPGIWDEVKELDMTQPANWVKLATALGVPYHLTLSGKDEFPGARHLWTRKYFEAVVVPQS